MAINRTAYEGDEAGRAYSHQRTPDTISNRLSPEMSGLILLGREVVVFLEQPGEVAQVGEPQLVADLRYGQVVVMDNATFHKGGRIGQLFQDASCKLLYLPPYSPDLNKIEQCWSCLKSRIRKKLDQFDCLRDAIEDTLRLMS